MLIYVNGIGIVGPGINDWPHCRAILAGQQAYNATEMRLAPTSLPATEKRRASSLVHLAVGAAEEAMRGAQLEFAHAASVFASSGSDGVTIHEICSALASKERDVSPTRFHNSVHNAPAGYWCIGAKSNQASTSLSCFDATFAAGLLEAALQVEVERMPILLAAYDQRYPTPLYEVRPLLASFSVAIVLSLDRNTDSLAALDLECVLNGEKETHMTQPELEALRLGNPAARALPLLDLIARKVSGRIVLKAAGTQQLVIKVTPCV